MKERIKFTTPGTALKELVSNGTDSDMASKVVAVASIIKSFTKNVEIDVSDSEVFHGEAWFYMKNTNENERFNNATAYKVLVNLIDPSIKVGAFLWPDDDNGTRDDVIDVNFFGYTLNTGNSEQAVSDDHDVKAWTSSGLKAKQDMREEEAMKEGRKLARSEAELWLKEAAESLNQGSKTEVDENIPGNPMRLMNLWGSDDEHERSIESWSNECYSFGEDE